MKKPDHANTGLSSKSQNGGGLPQSRKCVKFYGGHSFDSANAEKITGFVLKINIKYKQCFWGTGSGSRTGTAEPKKCGTVWNRNRWNRKNGGTDGTRTEKSLKF